MSDVPPIVIQISAIPSYSAVALYKLRLRLLLTADCPSVDMFKLHAFVIVTALMLPSALAQAAVWGQCTFLLLPRGRIFWSDFVRRWRHELDWTDYLRFRISMVSISAFHDGQHELDRAGLSVSTTTLGLASTLTCRHTILDPVDIGTRCLPVATTATSAASSTTAKATSIPATSSVAHSTTAATAPTSTGFVKANGQKFELDGKEYVLVGFVVVLGGARSVRN